MKGRTPKGSFVSKFNKRKDSKRSKQQHASDSNNSDMQYGNFVEILDGEMDEYDE